LTADSHRDTTLLRLKVHPNARRSEVVGFTDGILEVRVKAPPAEGRANRELTACLSRALGVSQSSLTIVKGQASRHKVIAVAGLSHEEIIRRLTT
jgi:uncharacterized protein (TIGR00251 family)